MYGDYFATLYNDEQTYGVCLKQNGLNCLRQQGPGKESAMLNEMNETFGCNVGYGERCYISSSYFFKVYSSGMIVASDCVDNDRVSISTSGQYLMNPGPC